MAKTLKLKLVQFNQALDTLNEALKKETDQFIRDSVIKRFEYSFELCWKTAKLFLSEYLGIEVFSPKQTFRELRKNQMTSEKDTVLLLQMTNDRNQIIHDYNEKYSDEICKTIRFSYYAAMQRILRTLEEENGENANL
ncbi:nucleotidyltransferase substrate binding protein [Patescibacteria group bacterium]|nr:nucleotidyltransferase substrate binding protein [Patescibacteria group bacterium]